MVASVASDAALVIFACIGLILAPAPAVLVWRKGFQRVDVRWGAMHASLEAVERKVDEVNRAVNHQPVTAPTLVQRVVALEGQQSWQNEAIQCIGEHVGADLPERP